MLVICIIALATVSPCRATHIVGGDFYYRQLGEFSYEITLKLYIDCENGDLGAIASDSTAYIAVFDAATNAYESSFIISRTGPIRLNKLQYKCVIPEQGVCVNQYSYVDTVELDPGAAGKILAFQRCCRNNTINNIVNPQSTGATYWVKIPGTDLVKNDNSPVFKELPPNYICTGSPLIFDHSATDPDGDSLVYELYTPYNGASQSVPRPTYLSAGSYKLPPFANVTWRGAYSDSNQIGGNPLLAIDAQTGLLTATPSTIGQYVIGIKVKEYRKGVLIGETLRDYQVNVRSCQFNLISSFTTALNTCSDTVKFTNQSTKATYYNWNFGDPYTNADTSHDENPVYIYPKHGKYTATLTVKNDSCEDVFYTVVNIVGKIKFDLGPDDTLCENKSMYLNTGFHDATKITWNTGQTAPAIWVNQSGIYIATVFYGVCSGADTIKLIMDSIQVDVSSDSVNCDSAYRVVEVSGFGNSAYTYSWNHPLEDNTSPYRIRNAGLYILTTSNGKCERKDTIVTSTMSSSFNLGPDRQFCDTFTVTLRAPAGFPKYVWSTLQNDSFITVKQPGNYHVTITDSNGCEKSDSVVLSLNDKPFKLILSNVFTPGIDGKNDAFDIDAENYSSYLLTIYNRWGEIVYLSDKDGYGNDGINWDGHYMNNPASPLPDGVYFYMLKIKEQCNTDAEMKEISGSITLIREK